MGTKYESEVSKRAESVDLTLEEAHTRVHEYSVVQLKYDGIWAKLRFDNGHYQIWSRHGQLKKSGAGYFPGSGEVIGEFLFGSNWAYRHGLDGRFMAFDVEGPEPYHERQDRVNALVATLPDWIIPVETWYLTDDVSPGLIHIWNAVVKGEAVPQFERYYQRPIGTPFEGLMLKRPNGPWLDPVIRLKRTLTVDYVCVGFNQSDAEKYKGRMVRSIVGALYDDKRKLVKVCNVGGMSEEERADMYKNPHRYIGRVFEASGKDVFPNGALRHPNFVRMRPDKRDRECTVQAAREVGGHGSSRNQSRCR